MPTVKRFEDLECWEKAREVTKLVYEITSIGAFGKDFGLRDQIRRASVSIMLNIAEGFARHTDKEFRQFLVRAHSSCAEVQAASYVALDRQYLTQEAFSVVFKGTEEVSKMIMSFTRYLSGGGSALPTLRPSTLDSRTRKGDQI